MAESGSNNASNAVNSSSILFMRYYQIRRYMAVAALALWLWDVLITLDMEITYVWKRKGRLIKTLYFLNRYLPLIVLGFTMHNLIPHVPLSVKACQILIIGPIVSYVMGLIIIPTIFVMRVYSISQSHLNARRILVLVTAVSHLLIVVFFILGTVSVAPTILYVNQFRTCTGKSHWAFGAFCTAPIFIETAVFLATIYHAISYSSTGTLLSQSPTTFILRTLYFDGAIYYLIVLTVRVAVIILLYGLPLGFIIVLSYLDFSITSVVTSRWFLSFRKAIAETQQDRMMDESDWTGSSPRLDTMFKKTRTTDTGPEITFYGTRGTTRDYGVHSMPAKAARPMNVTDTAANSNTHGGDLELSTLTRGFRTSLNRDRGVSNNLANPGSPRPRRSSRVNFTPSVV